MSESLYTVLSPHYQGYTWFPVAHQTLDYCHGFCDGANDPHLVIVNVEHVIVSPDERRFELAMAWERSTEFIEVQRMRALASHARPYNLLDAQPSAGIDSEVGYELYG